MDCKRCYVLLTNSVKEVTMYNSKHSHDMNKLKTIMFYKSTYLNDPLLGCWHCRWRYYFNIACKCHLMQQKTSSTHCFKQWRFDHRKLGDFSVPPFVFPQLTWIISLPLQHTHVYNYQAYVFFFFWGLHALWSHMKTFRYVSS